MAATKDSNAAWNDLGLDFFSPVFCGFLMSSKYLSILHLDGTLCESGLSTTSISSSSVSDDELSSLSLVSLSENG